MCEPLCAPLRKLQISQEGTKKSHRPGCLASSLLHGLGLRGIDAVELLLQALLEGVVYILVVPSSVIPFLLPLLHIRIDDRSTIFGCCACLFFDRLCCLFFLGVICEHLLPLYE